MNDPSDERRVDGGMTGEQYRATQDTIEMVCVALLSVFEDGELEAFLELVDRSESLGPILHPSEFMAAGEKLREVKRHARALLAARLAIGASL